MEMTTHLETHLNIPVNCTAIGSAGSKTHQFELKVVVTGTQDEIHEAASKSQAFLDELNRPMPLASPSVAYSPPLPSAFTGANAIGGAIGGTGDLGTRLTCLRLAIDRCREDGISGTKDLLEMAE